jgi:hypothetical protein
LSSSRWRSRPVQLRVPWTSYDKSDRAKPRPCTVVGVGGVEECAHELLSALRALRGREFTERVAPSSTQPDDLPLPPEPPG